jgi:MscS family membrane protein
MSMTSHEKPTGLSVASVLPGVFVAGAPRRSMRRPFHRGLIGLVCAALLIAPGAAVVSAQPPAPPTPAPEMKPHAPPDELGRGTPRGTVVGFLQATRWRDYKAAAEYLDLRRVPRAQVATEGPILARHLRVILDNTLLIDPDALSDNPDGSRDDGLPAMRELVGRIATDHGPMSILLERVPRDDGVLIWKFAQSTVARIPDLYREFGYGPVGEVLPPVLVERRPLGIALWQWGALFLLAGLAVLLARLIVAIGLRVLRVVLRQKPVGDAVKLPPEAVPPLRLLVAVGVFHAGRIALALPVAVRPAFNTVEGVITVIAVTWLATRLMDVVRDMARLAVIARGQMATLPVVDLAQRAAKLLILVLGLLTVLDVLGINVTALVAGLGVGGIAVALAAQKTVEHLFGGLTLIADQPVKVGDFCKFGDQVGTVERIGLRSTRLRTLDRTVVSVPNGDFANLRLENFAERDRIWLKATLGLRYETTPDQLRHVLVRLRELLYAHPRIDPDPARVRFVGFGPYTLDVEIYAYVRTADFNEFLGVREDLYLRIMDVVAASGTGFAFPSQTQYSGAEGLDAARAHQAESEVARWRAEGALPLPEFPAERVTSLRDTLDYPPKGSAQARRQAE